MKGAKGYNFGGFASLLVLTSLFLFAYILLNFEVLGSLTMPAIFMLIFGAHGFIFMIISGVHFRGGRFMLSLTGIVALVFAGILLISSIAGFLGPGASVDILGVPLWVWALLYGSVGVQESLLSQGIQTFLRRFWVKTKPALFFMGIFYFVYGVLWHEAVARTILSGSIFSSPEYVFFVGGSWVFFMAIFELVPWFDVVLLGHFSWNVFVTVLQAGVFA
jgi:hypothetical protein